MSNVLVVDDEKDIRTTLSVLLRSAGHRVEAAEEARAALKFLQSDSFDVVISDILLPCVTGMDLLRALRQVAPRVQVILMTGRPTVDTAAEAVRAGAFDYIVKPVSKEAILRSVSNAARVKSVDDEREKLAQENREYQASLERKVEERTLSLQQALDELKRTQEQVVQQERLKALGQMVSGIAHDFNNVLIPIVGWPEYLLTVPGALDNRADLIWKLERIFTAAKDAREIIRRLREFYHPEVLFEESPLVARELVEKVISLTEPAWKAQAQAQGKAICMESVFHANPTFPGNESALREALINLVLNAVDSIQKSGVIRFEVSEAEGWVILRVADTGCGMGEEARRRCFEPFFSTKGAHGTGLGLSLCHGIMERHGGSITVESSIEEGTTFTLRLPLRGRLGLCPAVVTPGVSAASEAPRIGASVSLRVLEIDDEEQSRDFVSTCLTREGHVVEAAISGADGLAKLAAGRYDLVLTDRAMPGMGGDAVALAVKRIAPGTPVLMVTGFGDLMGCTGDHPEGVDEILGKPLTARELVAAVERVSAKRVCAGI